MIPTLEWTQFDCDFILYASRESKKPNKNYHDFVFNVTSNFNSVNILEILSRALIYLEFYETKG